MCLGTPGRIVELNGEGQVARVDVIGVGRDISIALLESETLSIGDWVLIHVGFAMAKIDEEQAREALDALQLLGAADLDELEEPAESAGSTVGQVGDRALRR
jgi:hydrogenase expression/formation protein HypC